VTYELWDQASGNRIEGFEDVSGLVEIVRQIADLQGLGAVDDLFVEVWAELDADAPEAILRGNDLRRLIQPRIRTYALEVEVGGHPALSARTKTAQAETARTRIVVAI
jgi:hypothetical protein